MAFLSFSSSLCFLLLALCLDPAGAQAPVVHDEGCIHMPIIHSTNTNFFQNQKRATSVMLTNRSDIAYYAQLSIGNPKQNVLVQLDTGSFELWVNPDCSSLEGSDIAFCQSAGHYDTARSSSAKSLSTTKTLRYGIGSANVTYFTDDIYFPGINTGLKSVQFGVATTSVDEFSGILGIGYGQNMGTRYPNFIDQLKAQNATKVKAFTVALGSKDATEGVIVFGGVDTSKYVGNLARVPIVPMASAPDQVARYWVNLKSVGLTSPTGKGSRAAYPNSSIPVFLDSGSTMTLLPAPLAAAIAADFGAGAPDSGGFFSVSCDLLKANGTLDFTFEGVTIKVPYPELIRTVGSNPPACFLGISSSPDFTLLGDTFMRSSYITFDLETNVVWMAQAANCGSSPAALGDINALPNLKGACTVSNAFVSDVTGTNGSPSGGGSSAGLGASGPSNAGSSSSSRSSSLLTWATAAVAAIGIFLV